MLEKLRVGTIVTTHGLRGEVKVMPTTEDPERFLDLETVTLRPAAGGLRQTNGTEREAVITSVRFQKNMVLLAFEGIDTIEQAEALRNYALYIDRSEAIDLEEGEYFIGDYYGMQVLLEDGTDFGKVKDVMETGANLVFVVETSEKKEVLIPKAPNVMLECKPEEGYMKIHLLEGLLDL